MPSLPVTFNDNYVCIGRGVVGVDRTPEMVADALLRAMEICAEQRCFRILAENDQPLRHLTKENVEQFVQRLAFFPGLKVAVWSRQNAMHELTTYYVDLAGRHGTSVRYFTERDEALKWLGAK